MRSNPLTQNVNFFLSIALITVFAVFMTSIIFDAAQTTNPIKNATADLINAVAQN
jgi:hypothetical protein